MLKKEFTFSLSRGFASSMAAITCGMPLPFALGANFKTIHHAVTKHIGAMIKIDQSAL